MSDTENSVRAQNESTSDVDFYLVKAQSILRQMSSMKCYLNADAGNQFGEADLLARMEWVNSLNRHRWKDRGFHGCECQTRPRLGCSSQVTIAGFNRCKFNIY